MFSSPPKLAGWETGSELARAKTIKRNSKVASKRRDQHQQGETQRMGKSCCESLQEKVVGMELEIIELKKLLLQEQIRTSEMKKSKLSLRPSKGALLVC